MYNYNRDVYQAEHERQNAMRTAADRAVPEHLRSRTGARISGWLSANIVQPVGALLASAGATAAIQAGRLWRRASSRMAGMAVNAYHDAADIVGNLT